MLALLTGHVALVQLNGVFELRREFQFILEGVVQQSRIVEALPAKACVAHVRVCLRSIWQV